MNRRLILAAPLAALAIAGCGSSGSSTSSTTNAPATNARGTAAGADGEQRLPRVTWNGLAGRVDGAGQRRRQPIRHRDRAGQPGKLKAGDLLVSNFNDKANNQGTGTTIVQVTPAGKQLAVRDDRRATTCPGQLPRRRRADDRA